jgi:hypothetical protein
MLLLILSLLFAGAVAYPLVRSKRSRRREFQSSPVAGLIAMARGRLLAKVGTVDRAGEAVPEAASIWFFKDNNLVMKEGVEIKADQIVDAAVDYAAAHARAHQGGALTDPMVAEWLGQGVAKAIARLVLVGTDRMKKRMEVMVRTPRPTPAEIAFNRLENERDQAELAQLLGDPQAPVRIPSAISTKR